MIGLISWEASAISAYSIPRIATDNEEWLSATTMNSLRPEVSKTKLQFSRCLKAWTLEDKPTSHCRE